MGGLIWMILSLLMWHNPWKQRMLLLKLQNVQWKLDSNEFNKGTTSLARCPDSSSWVHLSILRHVQCKAAICNGSSLATYPSNAHTQSPKATKYHQNQPNIQSKLLSWAALIPQWVLVQRICMDIYGYAICIRHVITMMLLPRLCWLISFKRSPAVSLSSSTSCRSSGFYIPSCKCSC